MFARLACLCATLAVSAASFAAAPGDVLATVNDTKITQKMLDVYARQRGVEDLANLPAERRAMLVDELINRELLYRAALQDKLDKSGDTGAELESARLNILAGAAVRTRIEKSPAMTDDNLKKEYDKFVKEMPGLEYKTRHILLDSMEKANEVIAELDKGADFAKLVADKSAAGTEGGELEWFQANDMVKPFADATIALEKGAYTKMPVNTQYGWHVIQLLDTRKVEPPPFDQIKSQLQLRVRNSAVEELIKSLRDKAKVNIVTK